MVRATRELELHHGRGVITNTALIWWLGIVSARCRTIVETEAELHPLGSVRTARSKVAKGPTIDAKPETIVTPPDESLS